MEKKLLSAVILTLITGNILFVNGLSSTGDRGSRKLFGGYRITPKFCNASKSVVRDPTKRGPTICMFNHECSQRQGEVVGACMDGFLFGTCCELPLSDELPNMIKSNISQAQNSNHNQQKIESSFEENAEIDNGYFGGSDLNEDTSVQNFDTNKYDVPQDAVDVYPPSNKFSSSSTAVPKVEDSSMYLPPNPDTKYSPELPSLLNSYQDGSSIATGTTASDITASGVLNIASQLQDNYYDHSDITHPEAETVLLDNGSVDHSYAKPNDFLDITQTTEKVETQKPVKISYAKPQFKPKPKPTKPSDVNKYVLVHTISTIKDNETQTKPTVNVNDIESIESIILMLNDTKHGPQYDTDTKTNEILSTTSATFGSTSMIDFNKFGPTSFYVTDSQNNNNNNNKDSNSNNNDVGLSTKLPSTSYVYSPRPTKRPITESVVVQSTYVTPGISPPSSTVQPPINKRPVQNLIFQGTTNPDTVTISTVQPTKKVSTKITKRPIITTANLPEYVIQSSTLSHKGPTDPPKVNYVQISNGQNQPSPTVHITPKPINIVTQWTNNKLTSPSIFDGTKPGYYGSSSYQPVTQDFTDEGYFGVTKRPTTENTLAQSPIYSIVEDLNNNNKFPQYGPTSPYPNIASGSPIIVSQAVESVTLKNEVYTTPDDCNNFPPVRNPNLDFEHMHENLTKIQEDSMTTVPIKDDKVNLLVNKIVQTFQGNYEELEQILNERLNTTTLPTTTTLLEEVTSTTAKISTTKKRRKKPAKKPVNGTSTVTKKPATSVTQIVGNEVQPVTLTGGTATKPRPATAKPSKVTKRPTNTTRPAGTDIVRPTTVSGSKPVRPAATTNVKPVNGTKPSSTVARPGQVSTNASKPTYAPSNVPGRPGVTNKPPPSVPNRPGVTTTKRPRTTLKPGETLTKRPTARPTTFADSVAVTTKKPVRTRKPTRKATTTTTTTPAPQDELIEEAEEEENAIEEEDVGEESNETPESSGRILCGQRPMIRSGKIVGGKAAKMGEWPWQVLVRESTWLGLFTKNKCGGVLVNNGYVITAAHCQPGFLASLVAVFGEFDISGDLETKRSVTKNVKRVIVHRNYDAATFENDLAILELESPVHYDSHIVPICMPGDDADFTGRMATVTGWGRLKYGGGVPSVLQEVQVPVIENSVCQEMFQHAGHNKKILPSFVCAGYANGQKDSCEGDSGGPLVLQRDDGRYELAGTVSHGIKCASPFLPGVYMRTTYYKPWLKSITGVK